MCIAPILLENPYYNRGLNFEYNGNKCKLDIGGQYDFLHNTVDRYVSVPCGKCSQCISTRQNYYVQRIQMESMRSEIFYFTLTYANRGLKFTDKLGYKLPYPHFEDIQNLFKRLRAKLPHPILTFVVSEYGTKRKRPHYHGFIAVAKSDIQEHYRGSHLYCEKLLYQEVLFEWRRNIAKCLSKKVKGKIIPNTRSPHWVNLCDYVVKNKRTTYDLHWVQPIINHDNDVSYYVTKYLIKYDERTEKLLSKISIARKHNAYNDTIPDDYFKELLSQLKPRAVMSKKFGDYNYPPIRDYINKCISKSKDYPQYFDLHTGKAMLLCPYYRKHLVSPDYYLKRFADYHSALNNSPMSHLSSILVESYNPEYLDPDTVHDLNSRSSKAQRADRHLKRVKTLQHKKSL